MDSFHFYLKKQLLEYVEAERKKGIPLEQIEKVLLDAGHKKNIIDELFLELEKETAGQKVHHKKPIENDLIAMLKNAFLQFMAQANKKEIDDAKKNLKKTDTDELVKEVIEEAEVIEEKTMLESITFFLYLVGLGLVILFNAGVTDSEIVNVILGFTPTIVNVFISFMALKLADNVPIYVFIPLVIASIFYSVGKFTRFALFQGLDIEALAVVNFLLSFLFNILIVYVRFLKPKSMKRRITKTGKKIPKAKINSDTEPSSTKHAEREELLELKKEFNL
jgi:hypothetical protein